MKAQIENILNELNRDRITVSQAVDQVVSIIDESKKKKGKRIDNNEIIIGKYSYEFEHGYVSQGYDDVPPRCHYIDGVEVHSETLEDATFDYAKEDMELAFKAGAVGNDERIFVSKFEDIPRGSQEDLADIFKYFMNTNYPERSDS